MARGEGRRAREIERAQVLGCPCSHIGITRCNLSRRQVWTGTAVARDTYASVHFWRLHRGRVTLYSGIPGYGHGRSRLPGAVNGLVSPGLECPLRSGT